MSNNEFARGGTVGVVCTATNGKQTVLDIEAPGCLTGGPNGRYGMATIHIDVYDDENATFDPIDGNAVLKCDVRYGTERGVGEFTTDITRGRILSVGGCDAVHLAAYLESAISGEPIRPFANKRVSATCSWATSAQAKEPMITTPTIQLVAIDGVGVPSAYTKIPRQAQSVVIYTPTPALLGTLLLEFAHADAAGAPVSYATLNPNANGTDICHGVEFFRMTSPTTMLAFACFKLVA